MRTPIFTAALILSSAALAPAAGIVGSSANVNVRGAPNSIEPGVVEDSSAVTAFQEAVRRFSRRFAWPRTGSNRHASAGAAFLEQLLFFTGPRGHRCGKHDKWNIDLFS